MGTDEAGRAVAAGIRRVLVRVTLGVDADTHEAVVTGHHGSKFGLPPEAAPAVVADALSRGLDVLGVHVHVGSQLADFDAHAATIERLAAFAALCRAVGWTPAVADLGGGFGVRHVSASPRSISARWHGRRRRRRRSLGCARPPGARDRLEPGRASSGAPASRSTASEP